MLVAVVAIAAGADTGALAELSLASSGKIEQRLVDRLSGNQQPQGAMAMSGPAMAMQGPGAAMDAMAPSASGAMMSMSEASHDGPPAPNQGLAPGLDGATRWLNSKPLGAAQLRGKVVLVDFWTEVAPENRSS